MTLIIILLFDCLTPQSISFGDLSVYLLLFIDLVSHAFDFSLEVFCCDIFEILASFFKESQLSLTYLQNIVAIFDLLFVYLSHRCCVASSFPHWGAIIALGKHNRSIDIPSQNMISFLIELPNQMLQPLLLIIYVWGLHIVVLDILGEVFDLLQKHTIMLSGFLVGAGGFVGGEFYAGAVDVWESEWVGLWLL